MRRTLVLLPLLLAWAPGASAQQDVNRMHPPFAPLDAERQPALDTGRPVSSATTCGACHDVEFVSVHDSHRTAGVETECVACHFDGGRLVPTPELLDEHGLLRREAIRIGRPEDASCARCHGVIPAATGPVYLPDDFEAPRPVPGFERSFDLTLNEGAIAAGQDIADSFLNVENKSSLTTPWNAHAARLVDCTDCHYAANNPVRTDAKQHRPSYLREDPRRLDLAVFLRQPDHRLARPNCRACHDAVRAHDFLPYRARHMEVLACQTCHVPAMLGPALEMLDATVVTPAGAPVAIYRNVERQPGEPLNAARIFGMTPLLVPARESDGKTRLAPFNLVARWQWVSGDARAEVPLETVAQAYLDGGAYAASVLEVFDANRDGRIDGPELRLDSAAKVERMASRLRSLGVVEPAIEGTLEAHALVHGVVAPARAQRDCRRCHAGDSRLGDPFPVAPYLPGGVTPRLARREGFDLGGEIVPDGHGGLVLSHGATPPGYYVLGSSRHALTNVIGFVLFLLVCLACAVHGTLRVLARRRVGAKPHGPLKPVYLFSLYERLWHWVMTLSVTVLVLTGIEIHRPGTFGFGMPTMVWLHNFFAVVLAVNAFLSLFYHAATAAIRQFLPSSWQGFLKQLLEHLHFYTRGIFRGAPHPMRKSAERKLNPLQQVTYLLLLNVLFPWQVLSGALIWAVAQWPDVAASVGGLSIVAPLHNLGAWLFLTFYVLHHYLITTGHTTWSNLRSMVTGYDVVETEQPPAEGSAR